MSESKTSEQGWNFSIDVYVRADRSAATELGVKLAELLMEADERVVHTNLLDMDIPVYGGPIKLEGSDEEGWEIK